MNAQAMENARRQIAKECLIELRSHGIPNDKLTTQILDKYTLKFKPLITQSTTPKMLCANTSEICKRKRRIDRRNNK